LDNFTPYNDWRYPPPPRRGITMRLKTAAAQNGKPSIHPLRGDVACPAYGGRTTCESCPSIDVRQWHREGWLYPGQQFPLSWTYGGDSAGSITVQVECAAVLLSYRSCYSGSDNQLELGVVE